jgi:tryptophan halogenase
MNPGARIRRIVIVGGGIAGWMAAAVLKRMLPGDCEIRLIDGSADDTESADAAIGTLPHLRTLHAMLDIDEADLMRKTRATFRLGTLFRNWSGLDRSYFHPLGEIGANLEGVAFRHHWLRLRECGDAIDPFDFSLCAVAARAGKFTRPATNRRSVLSTLDYGYHFDGRLYADYLRRIAVERGVVRTQAAIAGVERQGGDGSVTAIVLEDGERVTGDLFLDCTGASAILSGQTLQTSFEDWTQWLPCDRIATATGGATANPMPYSGATACAAGWQSTIPLQHRTGHGYVYSSRDLIDEEAVTAVLTQTGGSPAAAPKLRSFTSGRRAKFWNGNVIALGQAGVVLEPLDGIELHLVQTGLIRLLTLFPYRDSSSGESEYNRLMTNEAERMRDFLVLHYKATTRQDSAFWTRCRDMAVPQTLDYKMRLFKSRGRVVLYDEETFDEASWASLFIGQDIIPERYIPLADTVDIEKIRSQLTRMRSAIRQGADSMPPHGVFLEKYCAAGKEAHA